MSDYNKKISTIYLIIYYVSIFISEQTFKSRSLCRSFFFFKLKSQNLKVDELDFNWNFFF